MLDSEIKTKIHQYLLQKTEFLKIKDKLTEDQLRIFVDRSISDLCKAEQIEILTEARIIFIRELITAVVSLGPIRPLMEDKAITEIMINGASAVFIQRFGKIELTDIRFGSNQQLQHLVQKILTASGSNRRVDESSPYVDFSMSDGSRVNVILPPCSLIGPVITIRKFSTEIGMIDDLLSRGQMDKKMATLLIAAMKAKLNVVFCGATGTGKTTTLNVLSRHIPDHERIITIEDTPELRLLQRHVVSLITKPANIEGKGAITIRDLFINSLRMRPDRIIIGEVRSDEMLDLIQSISSGHSGSLAIVHADSPEDCFNRMVTMMLMAGIRLSTQEIRKQVARAIDILVYIELFPDGVRRINNITEAIYDRDQDKITLDDIFRFEQDKTEIAGKITGTWSMNRKRPLFYSKFLKRQVALPEGFFD